MSDVSICSNALLRLGSQTINSLEETTDRAKIASNLYKTVREDILRGHDWNCAKKRVLLSPLVAKPAFDWQNQFLLPGDWVKNVQVGSLGCPIDFIKEGNMLLANAASLPLIYISSDINSTFFDKLLTGVLEIAMAHAMAYNITKSTAVEQAKAQELEIALRRARNADAQDEPAQTLGDFPLLESRFGPVRIPGQ